MKQSHTQASTLIRFLTLIFLISAGLSTPAFSDSSEQWKGDPDPSTFDFSALTGLGQVDPKAGFSIVAAVSKKIVQEGFIPEIRNSVSIEAEVGPVLVVGTSAFQYSAHLRWDFRRDNTWTFFALGGLGGHISGAALGDRFVLHPRVGVGALWQVSPVIRLRGEVSHEMTLVGVNFPL